MASLNEAYEPAAIDAPSDLMIDFEEALGRLPPVDATICRLRLVEERTFEEIGETLGGLNRSTAKRGFDRCLPVVREILKDYEPKAA